jgi:glucose-1-phosphate cytidylyltransferase
MKVVILAGGYGTRLSEETTLKPKPMVEIGEKPMLWHIMKYYSHFGFHEFIIALGYKGYIIKEYFANYFIHSSDITFDLSNNTWQIHQKYAEPWKVTLVDTGLNSMTGGRIKRVTPYVDNETFMLTYGDGLSNVALNQLLDYHHAHGRIATVTSVLPNGRFGALDMDTDGMVQSFQEKPPGDGNRINGGFFVLEPDVFSYINDDDTIFEQEPLRTLAADHQLYGYNHQGFWQPMDTLRDKHYLESLWTEGKAPWKVWES